MKTVMTPSELVADALVRAYLNGRGLPKILHSAVVWVAATRLTSGEIPVLDKTLKQDIDNQSSAPPAHFKVRGPPADGSTVAAPS